MKTRIIHTRFWKDEYISNLSIREKLVFMYLLTNDCVNMCGTYELPDKYICVDTGITQKELDPIKDKFSLDGKFFFSKGWVKIIKHDKYNSYGKGMQEKALAKELNDIPEFILDTSIDTSIYTRPNTEIRNKKQEIINNKDIEKITFSKLEDITDSVLEEIAENYEVSVEFVRDSFDTMSNYCSAHGKVYRNYKASLINFVKGNKIKFVERNIKNGTRIAKFTD